MFEGLFVEIGLVTTISLLVTGFVILLKQPIIIGYILSGIILGPYFLNITKSSDTIGIFSQLGVVLLLFLVGIGLNPRLIKDVGRVSVVTGVGQIIFTSLVGFLLLKGLGFSNIVSFYLSIALTFSSTIIIMKILTDKEDTESVYGRISIGFLIVQDIVAMLLLLFTSSFANQSESIIDDIFLTILKLIFGVLFFYLIGYYVLPRTMKLIAISQEYLLLASIGWAMIVAISFHLIGFSMEIGALLAGISLASSPYRIEISSKLKPLRDFFVFMFFVLLGSQMIFENFHQMIIPIIILSLFILFGNPLIVMIIMGLMGYTKKNSFLAGLTVAQISEFSLIYISLGIKIGHLPKEILPLVALVGLITIAGSTYMMIYSNRIYYAISKYLKIFEKRGKKIDELKFHKGSDYDVLLFGFNRMGRNIQKSLDNMGVKYLVIDYNPEVIKELSDMGIDSRYGDASDIELLDEINMCKTKIIISTVKDFETNELLIKKIRERNPKTIVITASNREDEALELYKKGASYVILPHHLGGYQAAMLIEECGFDVKRFLQEKIKQQEQLAGLC